MAKKIVDAMLNAGVQALREAVQDQAQDTLKKAGEFLEQANELIIGGKPAAAVPSDPWPEWYSTALNSPGITTDPTKIADFHARDLSRSLANQQLGQRILQHQIDMKNIR